MGAGGVGLLTCLHRGKLTRPGRPKGALGRPLFSHLCFRAGASSPTECAGARVRPCRPRFTIAGAAYCVCGLVAAPYEAVFASCRRRACRVPLAGLGCACAGTQCSMCRSTAIRE
eukprot:GSA120T00002826001.1